MLDSLISFAVIAALVYGFVRLLNAFAFKTAPARPWIAWSLTAVVVVAAFFALFFAQVLTRGGGAKPDFIFPFLFAWLFFASLNKAKKSKAVQS